MDLGSHTLGKNHREGGDTAQRGGHEDGKGLGTPVPTSGRERQRPGRSGGGCCSAELGCGVTGTSGGTGTGCSGSWRGERCWVKLWGGSAPCLPSPSPDAHLGEGASGELQLLLEQVAQHLVLPLQLKDTFLQLDALLTQVLAGVWGVSQDA